MILKSLEMQGFKSFPDKTVLTFDKGITCVVGPNGSGKSNVSDAVRWVLGEQSTKSLRGSKMEDVVFSGTGVRRAQGFAEVTLRLDNSDRSLSLDEDEVAVTRRYYRSGEGEYRINGNAVRLKDIHELFMDTGLGRDGYSIVSQGKIADMISAKSGERREMFEEAAGISHYRYRRADANRRLEQAQENLVRLKDILSELEARVEPLREQSEKAERFLVLAQEKKELEIGLWLHTIRQSNERLREQEHKIALANAQHEGAQRELAEIEEEIESIIAQSQEVTVRIDEVRHGAARLEEEAARLEAQAAVADNSILHNNEAIARIQRDREQAQETCRHLEARMGQARGAIEQLIAQAEEKHAALESLSRQAAQFNAQGEALAGRSAEMAAEIAELGGQVADCRVQSSHVESTMAEITSRVETIDETFAARSELIERLSREKQAAEAAFAKCGEMVEELSNAMKGYSMRLDSRRAKAEKRKKEHESLEIDLRQKTSRVNMLEDMEKNMEGYTGSVRAVMREAKRGNLRGIHGALSQLISVPDQYATAIETAFGAALQNIVTDSENDAKRAIQFLKETKGGRATFLPLSAVRGRTLEERGLAQCEGFVAVASDLVSCDAKYEAVVKAQVGRTAVAENMDCAIAIARKFSYRFRIVTLDGQVINAGGSMTGGSRMQNAGFLSRSNEIEKLRAEMQAAQAKLNESAAAYKTAREEFAAAQAEFEGAQADLTRAQEDRVRSESALRLAAGQLETANATADELVKERESALERLEGLKKDQEAALAREAELSARMEEAEQRLAAVTGEREALAAKRQALSGQENELQLSLLAAEKDRQAHAETIESLERRRAGHLARVEELRAEIAGMEEKNRALAEEKAGLEEQAQSLRGQSGGSKEEIEGYIAQRNELEARSSKLRLMERAKSAEREKLSGELARLEERKAAMRKEYDETVNKLYDEYQLTRREAEQLCPELKEPAKAQRRLSELKAQIRALGSVNVSAIEEYKEVSERYTFLKEQIGDVEASRDELLRLIEELTKKMSDQFREQFYKINTHFGETFTELFGGGKAELLLEDPHEVLECGIDIKVQPPGKNVQNIDLLSGGEKGLSAIALLFAILKVTPSPFCIFDEVEAALDDVNVTRYAQYCRRMTRSTQFILITHRRGTMEEADVLYGITMQEEGVSKMLELKTAEMAKKLGIG